MSIGALYEDDRFAAADYEAVMAQIGEEPPEGCLVHIGGPSLRGVPGRYLLLWSHPARETPALFVLRMPVEAKSARVRGGQGIHP